MDLLSIVVKGGWVMVPIALCSLIAVFIVVERFLILRKAQVDVGQFMLKIKSIFRKGDVSGVLNFCAQKDAPIANILRRGLEKYDGGEARVKEAIESAGKAEIYHLEKRLAILGAIAGIAPMLGFLGTVTGMVAAFRKIEMLGGNATPSDLAGGIWEALLTTVFGLIVGIFAYAFYNYFVTRVTRFVFEMENSSTEFLDMLQSSGSGASKSEESVLSEGKSYGPEETFVRSKR